MAYRSIAMFHVKPGREEEFEQAYLEGEFLERAAIIPGFLGGEFLRLAGGGTPYVAIALWDTEASYRAWQEAYGTLPRDKVAVVVEAQEFLESGKVFEILRTTSGNQTKPKIAPLVGGRTIPMDIKPVFTPPTVAEMEDRLARVRTRMEREGLTHYVAHCPDNVFYLTNFANFVHERPFIVVVSLDLSLQFLVPKLEIPHVGVRGIGEIELVEYFEFPAPEGENWFDRFSAIFPDDAKVGVEATSPLQVVEAIPGAWVRSEIIDDVRQVKSEYEIGRIAYSSNLATEAMELLLKTARPGATIRDVNSKVSAVALGGLLTDNFNANMLATKFSGIFQPPSVSHDPHNFTDIDVQMELGGPHVSLVAGTLNGYGTEVERTFFLGDVPEEARKPYDVMMEARAKAFELTVPGNVMSDVDAACNDIFKRAGYEDYLLHRTGHSIGVTGHEAPFLAKGYERVIEPGMFFTIEPGCYLPDVGGFRHSDTVLVTAEGNVSLTPVADSLEEMTLPVA